MCQLISRDKNRSTIIMSIYEQAGAFIYYSYKACIVEHISFSGIWCYFNPDSWYRLATTIMLYDLWHIHTARDRDQNQWVVIYFSKMFTLVRNNDRNQNPLFPIVPVSFPLPVVVPIAVPVPVPRSVNKS